MNSRHSHLTLGATLYLPATRGDLGAVISGSRYPFLRSVVVCTEDSIRQDELPAGLNGLRDCLSAIGDGPRVFVRPRSPEVLARIMDMPGIEAVDGFVFPKATAVTLARFLRRLPSTHDFTMMPTLETREVFDPAAMADLRCMLLEPELRDRIVALRIGGNDLLHLLGLRRTPGRTIYDTPLGSVIAAMVTTFRPYGLPLTAPVFEDFGNTEGLRAEVLRDLEHGLVGKTAIHPLQVQWIEKEYAVASRDVLAARRILADDAPAVFQVDRIMCEPATHAAWAREVTARAEIYGVAPNEPAEFCRLALVDGRPA